LIDFWPFFGLKFWPFFVIFWPFFGIFWHFWTSSRKSIFYCVSVRKREKWSFLDSKKVSQTCEFHVGNCFYQKSYICMKFFLHLPCTLFSVHYHTSLRDRKSGICHFWPFLTIFRDPPFPIKKWVFYKWPQKMMKNVSILCHILCYNLYFYVIDNFIFYNFMFMLYKRWKI